MKRKRFVKMLMAKGYSRNTANSIASTVPACRISYEKVYQSLLDLKKLSSAITGFCNGLTEFVSKFTGIVSDFIGKAASAISKIAISERTKQNE